MQIISKTKCQRVVNAWAMFREVVVYSLYKALMKYPQCVTIVVTIGVTEMGKSCI